MGIIQESKAEALKKAVGGNVGVAEAAPAVAEPAVESVVAAEEVQEEAPAPAVEDDGGVVPPSDGKPERKKAARVVKGVRKKR